MSEVNILNTKTREGVFTNMKVGETNHFYDALQLAKEHDWNHDDITLDDLDNTNKYECKCQKCKKSKLSCADCAECIEIMIKEDSYFDIEEAPPRKQKVAKEKKAKAKARKNHQSEEY